MWVDADVEAALAWQDEQASLCPGCATPTDETMAPDAGYFAEAVICKKCAAREGAAAQLSDEGGAKGVLWVVKPSPPLIPD
jgi:hypothetical protein